MTATTDALPEHSPLGGSGASRWMKCPGSVTLSRGIGDVESDYAAEGTAAHKLAETCLLTGVPAWSLIGQPMYTPGEGEAIQVDKEMADAVQIFVDAVDLAFPERDQGNTWVEKFFYCPDLHPMYFGRSDLVYLERDKRRLHVIDYKHGAGIVVDVEDNPQLKYYGCGVLEELWLWGEVDEVVLTIAQPRGFHWAGPVRSWTVDTETLGAWLEGELLPAMNEAMVSTATASGEHCRFCPAHSRACPQILADIEEMEALMAEAEAKGGVQELTNDQVARLLELNEVAKIAAKAAQQTAFVRLQNGHDVPGWKLAPAKVNREWKKSAEPRAKKLFGEKAFERKMLSPAQLEKLPKGNEFVAANAFKPEARLTVVREGDARPAVNKSVKSAFEPVSKRKGKRKHG